jgi:hypothetical protein
MNDLQPSEPMPIAAPSLVEAAGPNEDADYALGCECAYPTLQIERWSDEAAAGNA